FPVLQGNLLAIDHEAYRFLSGAELPDLVDIGADRLRKRYDFAPARIVDIAESDDDSQPLRLQLSRTFDGSAFSRLEHELLEMQQILRQRFARPFEQCEEVGVIERLPRAQFIHRNLHRRS